MGKALPKLAIKTLEQRLQTLLNVYIVNYGQVFADRD